MPRGIPKNPTAGLIGVLNTQRKKLVAACAKAEKDLANFDKTLSALAKGAKATGASATAKRGPGRPRKATTVGRKAKPVNGRRRRVGRPPKAGAVRRGRPPGSKTRRGARGGGMTQTEAIRRVLASSHRTKVGDLVRTAKSRFNVDLKTSSASTSLSLMKRAKEVRNDKNGWYLARRG